MKNIITILIVILGSGCAAYGPVLDPTYNAKARIKRCEIFGYTGTEAAECAMKLQMAAEGYVIPQQLSHGAIE